MASRISKGLAATAALTLAACQVGPNFHAPAAPAVAGYTPTPLAPVVLPAAAGPSQAFVRGLDVPGPWWTLYRSTQLEALIARALKANPDLDAAQAALRVAREAYYAQRAALLPTLDASYSGSAQKFSDALASPLSSNAELFTLHTAQLSVGYTPDVFGGIRRQTETVKAQADAQRFQTEAAYLTLIANLVAAAVQQASLAEQISETQALIASDRRVLALMQQQQRLGQIAQTDLAQQESLVAQAEQTLPPLEKQLAQQGDLIADLTGGYPDQTPPAPLALAELELPQQLPVSLPSDLVLQRPDIRMAEANLHAASAQVGVAIAARLPSFPLSVTAGGSSPNLPSLFTSGNTFWSLTGGVSQPIFEGGALLHKQRGAEAALDQAEAQYRSTVLAAFQNVADSLQALRADARALQAAAAADHGAERTLALTRRQYKAGEAGILPVLVAEQARQQALLALTQAKAARYADTAALFQALGGGWWNRDDIPSADQGGAAVASLGRK
jgi:NodT family efflux transporter outer membrane factor (OMF) lipoprotein